MPSALLHLAALYLVTVLLMIVATRFALTAPVPLPLWKWSVPKEVEHLPWWARALLASLAVVAALNLGVTGLAHVTFWADLRPVVLFACVGGVAFITSQHIDNLPKRATVIVAAAAIALAWYEYPSWLTVDAISAVIAVYMVLVLQPLITFRTLAVIGVMLAAGFDLVSVNYTGSMVRYANNVIAANMPGLILIPTHLALSSTMASAIGIGDIVFPATLIISAGRLAQRTQCRAVYVWALGGYAVGLLAAFVELTLTDSPQPATIFTIPAVVAASLAAVYYNKLQAELQVKLTVGPQPRW